MVARERCTLELYEYRLPTTGKGEEEDKVSYGRAGKGKGIKKGDGELRKRSECVRIRKEKGRHFWGVWRLPCPASEWDSERV